ncbi:MAG: hypothetical protein ACTSRB_13415 [Candidatus Helarchaeota archaeon]
MDAKNFWQRVRSAQKDWQKDAIQLQKKQESRMKKLALGRSQNLRVKRSKPVSTSQVIFPQNVQELEKVLDDVLNLTPLKAISYQEDGTKSPEELLEVIKEHYLPERMEGPLPYDLKHVLALLILGYLASGDLKNEFRQKIVEETNFRVWDEGELKLFSSEITRKYKYWWHLTEEDGRYYTRQGIIHPWTFLWLLVQPPDVLSHFLMKLQVFVKKINHEDFITISNPIILISASIKRLNFTPLDLIFFKKLSEYFPQTTRDSLSYYKTPRSIFNAEKIRDILDTIAKEINVSFASDAKPESFIPRLKKIQRYFGIIYFYLIPLQVIDRKTLIVQFEELGVLSNFHINLPHNVLMDQNELQFSPPNRHVGMLLKEFRKRSSIKDVFELSYIILPFHSLEMYDMALQGWKMNSELLHGALMKAESKIESSHRKLITPRINASPMLDRDYINLYFYRTSFFQMGPDTRLRENLGLSVRKFYQMDEDLRRSAPYGILPLIQKLQTFESGHIYIEGDQEWHLDFLYQITKYIPTKFYVVAKGKKSTRCYCFFFAPRGMTLQWGKFYKSTLPEYYPELNFWFENKPISQHYGMGNSNQWDIEQGYWRDDYKIRF